MQRVSFVFSVQLVGKVHPYGGSCGLSVCVVFHMHAGACISTLHGVTSHGGLLEALLSSPALSGVGSDECEDEPCWSSVT